MPDDLVLAAGGKSLVYVSALGGAAWSKWASPHPRGTGKSVWMPSDYVGW